MKLISSNMSSSLSFQVPKALPSLFPKCTRRLPPFSISSSHRPTHNVKANTGIDIKPEDNKIGGMKFGSLAIQLGAFLATVEQPALAITGVNNQEDLTTVLIQSAFIGFWYIIIMPPIVLNWVRIRFYRRKLLERYLQFMCVFLFFPGILLWAPFLNFRKFPRDPDMKYPWSTPKDPSKIKNGYLKYPFATPEDYE